MNPDDIKMLSSPHARYEQPVATPPGFFVGQQVTVVARRFGGRDFHATHAHVVQLGVTSFEAEDRASRIRSHHEFADEGATWSRGWVEDADSLIAARMLMESLK